MTDLAEFVALWQLPPEIVVERRPFLGTKSLSADVAGRRVDWWPPTDGYPFGILWPRRCGWNPVMVTPDHLALWLSVPDQELRSVHRANARFMRRRELGWRAAWWGGLVSAGFVGWVTVGSGAVTWGSVGAAAAVLVGMTGTAVGVAAAAISARRDSSIDTYRCRVAAGSHPRPVAQDRDDRSPGG